ncbi:TPA: ferredoxin [Streptococcus pyogenes]|uniref:Ferredoxin n=5 Tax=Streptococcus pyogenes TaxID=1314 RepID=Q9A0F2_STRP1|nr:ferredoxin [Streptococcus pyogenes]ABF35733.1 Ferredoxin [Streptococcus pyogenes MGAS2096]AIG50167.1 ferredoxin [Streptococcus pyogenes STAB901]EPZ44723.1 4Fe-4S single cluster domain protein [Streptococcus pyogenes GA41345]EPZ48037.1 4Fe-4S single cluster domain protein [Streptococcus pyogenes GA40634]EQL78499.1 4Fe-4S single cluster domain protein [Streptococcus pyogenes UTSW-2]EQL82903.1 4Fe-4S single cluster domain protein [Streptococcus pyogenes GA19681]ERL21198.1 4Fe-4S single clust
MKVSIIPEKCIACGLCQTYSSLFDYHDNGIVTFSSSSETSQSICPSDKDAILAVKSCPTKALTLE